MLPSAPLENLETAAWPVHSSSINPPRSDPSCLSSDDFLRAPIFADSLGRRTDFVSSTVLRWCNASHIRAHSTTVVTPASPLRAWDASNSKGKKSPIYLLVQHWWHFFSFLICKVELNYGTYFLKKSAETLHVLFWFCCKPFTTSIGWLMHECKCYFFCNSEIAHGHAWLHHQELHCLSDNFTSIHYGKKEVNLVLLGSDLQLRICLPVEQCSDSDGAIHRAQCVTDCVLVCLCISSLQTTSVGGCV